MRYTILGWKLARVGQDSKAVDVPLIWTIEDPGRANWNLNSRITSVYS